MILLHYIMPRYNGLRKVGERVGCAGLGWGE